MRHLLKIGMATLTMLCFGMLSAQQAGWAGENPTLRAVNCSFFTLTPNPTNATCNGANNGIASVTMTGGVGPFTFIWVGGPTTQSWSGLGAGTYTVIVFDQGQGGAACNIDVIVNEPGPLSVFAMNTVSPTCFGACNGTAAPIVIGGAGGYTFSWSNGQDGPSADNLCNPFSLTIIDASGCIEDTTYVFIDEPQEIVITGNVTPISCFGQNDGAIEINITGGSQGFNYNWTGPNGFISGSQNISNLAAGSYTITITDQNNCSADSSFTLAEPDELVVVADITENACATDTLAAINITISGGTFPYNVTWDGPNGFSSNSENIINLLTGTYNLLLTDSNNCLFNASYEVTAPPLIEITLTATNVSCAGENDGAITTEITGGSGNYTLLWTGPNGFTSADLNLINLQSGTYELIVTDDTGCSNTASVEILDADSIIVNSSFTDVTCAGENDGTIDLTISGGTPAYVVSWSGPNGFTSSFESLTGLQAGTYSYTVTDINNCESVGVITLQEPDALDISGTTEDVLCGGINNGFINLTINGGQPDYTIVWSGPNGFSSNDQNIINLEAGVYNVTVLDSENCSQSTSFTILENDPIVLDAVLEQPDCSDENTGSITLTITGGNPNPDGGGNPIYIIEWTGADGFTASSASINLLAPGSYTVVVEDGNGCETTETYEIIAPDELVLNAFVQGVSCVGGDGLINLTVTGGAPDYTYQWTGPDGFNSALQNLTNLMPGSYTVEVTDVNSCAVTETFEVSDTEPIIINATLTDNQCQGVTDGSIILDITGGIAPYTFQWTGPDGFTSTDEDILFLDSGTYSVLVTDSAGCTEQGTYILIELVGLIAEATITDADCENNNDGAITVVVSGGTEPYSTFWIGPDGFTANGLTITGLQAGEYIFVATDAADCFVEQPFIVSNPSSLIADAVITDILCNGGTNGAIEITITGVIPVLSISWTGPNGFTSTNQNISGLSGGTYILTITDENDCLLIESYTLSEPDELLLTLTETQPGCGLTNGSITSTISGGTPDYSFVWTDELNNIISTDASIGNLGGGTYTLTITDANSCTTNASVVLIENVLDVSANITPVSCAGIDDGQIELTITGGIQPYTVIWNGPDGFASNNPTISNLASGDYTVQVLDDNNCPFTASYSISAAIQIDLDAALTPAGCVGQNVGSITLTISGGAPNYNVEWTGPNGFSSVDQNISNLEAGSYTVDITDAIGCFATAGFEVIESLPIIVDAELNNVLCPGVFDGFINLTITGGSPAFTFSWTGPNGFTSADQDIMGLEAGEYTVVVTDNLGCNQEESYTLIEIEGLEIEATITDANCTSNDDGAITVVLIGGTPPYSTFWLGPNGFTGNGLSISGLEAGVYTFVATDSEDCFVEIPLVVNNPSSVSATAEITNVLCAGESNGAITLILDGVSGPIDITWSGPNGFSSNDHNINGLIAGDYQLTIIDQDGCLFNAFYEISEPAELVVSIQVTHPTCASSNGEMLANVSGGTTDYNYEWTDELNNVVGTDANISGLGEGTYTLTITDANGCQATTSATLTETVLTASANITPVSCAGIDDGQIELTITSGAMPYIVVWSGPNGFSSNNPTITNLAAGDYTVQVLDDNDCLFTDTYTVSAALQIDLDAALTPAGCVGQNAGSITLALAGGTPGYTVEWTGPNGFSSTNQNITNLAAGSYAVEVTDAIGCFATASFELNESIPIIVDAEINDMQCQGVEDGFINLTITGGSPGFSFSWTGPNGFSSTDQDIMGLVAGEYTVTITDNLGCTHQETYNIIEIEGLEIEATITDANCADNDDGAITVILTGGTPPYSTFWLGPNGFTSNGISISGLEAGVYTFVATDSEDCFVEIPLVVNNPSTVTATADITNILCAGESNGAITLILDGVSGPIDITWSGPNGFSSNDQNINGLIAGDYQLTIIDQDGCLFNAFYEISEPAELVVSIQVTHPTCGSSNGELIANVSGGTTDYIYEWTDALNNIIGTNANISGLAAGTYTLTITDANGCEATASATLTETVLSASANITPVSCAGINDGQIELTITGGALPYIVIWSGPNVFSSNNPTISNLAAGDYTVQVLDDNDCLFTDTYTVSAAIQIDIDAALTPAGCVGQNAGSITLTISGGTPNYNFEWTGPNGFTSTSQNITNLAAGSYSVGVTDAIGCFATASFEVIESLPIIIDAELNNVLCQGVFDGFINLTITGGSPGFTFSWTGPSGFSSTDQDIMGLLAGDYTVVVTDNLGCNQEETYTLIEIEGLTIEATITDANCADNDDGAISVEIFAGTPPYSSFWLGPNGFTANGLSISGLEAGVYTFVATDSEDCFIEIPLVVNNPLSVTVTADITDVLCAGENTGSITLTLDGAGLIEITWSGPNGFSSNDQNISGLIAGNYQLTITDVDGCLFNAIYEITEPDALVVSVQTTQPTCALSNGQLVANISGGTPAYQILWTDALNNILGTDPALSDLAAGTYTLTVADDNGCSYSETFELIDSDITVNATITEILCHQDNNGAISLNINGGQQPYIVVWSGPNGFSSNSPSISNLVPGTYDVTVLDDSNCSVSLSFEITEPALLELAATAIPSSCLQNNGSVSAIISGGTIATDYNISWLDENNIEIGTDATINNLPAGIYTVIVSDDNGCEVTDQVAVSDQDGTISATLQNPTCGGANDGSISAEITGGTEPYTILWNGPNGFTSSDLDISNLETGVYTITVTDSLGCIFTDLYDLTEPAPFSLNLSATPISCSGDENGTITLTTGGGISPYQFVWIGPNGFSSTDQNLIDLAAGIYSVVVIDSLSCSSTADIEILSPNPITAVFDIVNNLCSTDSTGSISVALAGGNNPFTFQWISSNGFTSNQQNISNLAPGFYELLVTDSIGCSAQFDATITSSPELLVDFTITPTNCFGAENGIIESIVSGGTPNYTYSWSGPNGFSSSDALIENLAAGVYFLTLIDSNLCSLQDSIVLTQPDSLFAEINATGVLCFGEENGTIEAIINGGTSPYTTNWTGPDGFSSSQLTLINLMPGEYNLSVADSNGCAYNTLVTIINPEPLGVSLAQMTDALCNTDNSGSITIDVVGGTEPYTFSWTGPNDYSSNEQNPDSLFPGTYNLLLTDTNGCFNFLEVTIGFTFEISADAGTNFGICQEDQPIVLNGTAVNATEVQWLNPQGFVISDQPSVETLSVPGTFTYYFVVSNGLCTAIDSVTVTIHPQPNVSAGVNETIFEGDEAIIGGFPTSSTGILFQWTPGESLNDSTNANPIATPIVTTQYTVTVTDANGCVGIDSLLITVIAEISFPSGITPNGDGINDTWIIDYIDLYPNNVVELYSRWGDLLYRAEGYDNNDPWDGFYNGKELPVGTYYYIVELRDERYPEPFTGPITIFR